MRATLKWAYKKLNHWHSRGIYNIPRVIKTTRKSLPLISHHTQFAFKRIIIAQRIYNCSCHGLERQTMNAHMSAGETKKEFLLIAQMLIICVCVRPIKSWQHAARLCLWCFCVGPRRRQGKKFTRHECYAFYYYYYYNQQQQKLGHKEFNIPPLFSVMQRAVLAAAPDAFSIWLVHLRIPRSLILGYGCVWMRENKLLWCRLIAHWCSDYLLFDTLNNG